MTNNPFNTDLFCLDYYNLYYLVPCRTRSVRIRKGMGYYNNLNYLDYYICIISITGVTIIIYITWITIISITWAHVARALQRQQRVDIVLQETPPCGDFGGER